MDQKRDDVWAVVNSNGKTFLGKVVEAHRGDEVHTETSLILQEITTEADTVVLCPVYDFFSPLRPVQIGPQEVGYSRDPVITPLDFTMEAVPLYVRVSSLYLLNQMSERDRATYEEFMKRAEQQKTANRAKRSGLHIVESGGIKR